MIDTAQEELIAVRDIPKHVPGNRPHIGTCWRWILSGTRGVKLESVLVGGRRYTSTEALERFFSATTAAASGEAIPARTPRQRQKAVANAMKELEAAGV